MRLIEFVSRPVTLDEVAESAIVEEGLVLVTSEHRFADCHDVLQLCGNLVSVQDNIPSLAHKSVKDLLLSADVTGRPANDYEDYEAEIGRICLTYLAFLEDSYCFELGGTSTGCLERVRKSYPFLEYAAAMWLHHLRRRSRQIVLQDLIRSSLNLLGQAMLWQTWPILQPADIWDNQIQLAVFVSDAVIRSPDLPGWALGFWGVRQNLRKKDSSRSSYPLGVQSSANRFFTEVRGKQEYTLAVLLLEIALQKRLESITAQEASFGSTYDTLDSHLQLLHEKTQKAQSRMGQKYGDVIRDCIKLASLGTENLPGVAAPVSDDQKQQILWERCCQPLQYLARAGFAKAPGFNVVPSTDLEWGEEDNVFGFFAAGISAHESTDRDESSEVTLVEFATLLDGPDLEIKEARKRTALSNRTHGLLQVPTECSMAPFKVAISEDQA